MPKLKKSSKLAKTKVSIKSSKKEQRSSPVYPAAGGAVAAGAAAAAPAAGAADAKKGAAKEEAKKEEKKEESDGEGDDMVSQRSFTREEKNWNENHTDLMILLFRALVYSIRDQADKHQHNRHFICIRQSHIVIIPRTCYVCFRWSLYACFVLICEDKKRTRKT